MNTFLHILRWIILPFATILSLFISGFTILAFSSEFSYGSGETWNLMTQYVFGPFIMTVFFVLIGVWIAPTHKKHTACVLATLLTLFAIFDNIQKYTDGSTALLWLSTNFVFACLGAWATVYYLNNRE